MKHILILTSDGGGGHVSAANAIEQHLCNTYLISHVHVFKEILIDLDIFKKITFGRYSGEDLYNILLPKKYLKLISFLFFYFGPWYITMRHKKIRNLLHTYFNKTKPDAIISVIPAINDIVLSLAQELNIPFMVIPTDLDITLYIKGIHNPTHQRFKLCLPFNDPYITKPTQKALIAQQYISFIGSPLQESFLIPKNKTELHHHYHIPTDKPTVMMLMGAQGSTETVHYAHHLAQIPIPFHLIMCIGKNHSIKTLLNKIHFPSHLSTSIVDFTPHIADLMAMADLLITKPGTISVCEAIYINTPLFLDATSDALPWERLNYAFIKKHQFGDIISSHTTIAPMIFDALRHKNILESYKQHLAAFHKQDVREQLLQVLGELL